MNMNLAQFGAAVAYSLKRAADENDDDADDKKKKPAPSKGKSGDDDKNLRRQRARNRAEDLVPMKGFGRGLADYIAPFTFGGTRAGRATMVARALGQEPEFSVTNPFTDTALSGNILGLGGALGGGLLGGLGGALTGDMDNAVIGALGGAGVGSGLGTVAGIAGSGNHRREQMQQIQDSLATELEGHGTSRLKLNPPQYSALSSTLMPFSGAHRAGQADAYEALKNNTRYAKTPGRHAGYVAQHMSLPGLLVASPLQGIAQNFSARNRMKGAPVSQEPIEDNYGLDEFGPAKAASAFNFGVKLALNMYDPRVLGAGGGAAIGAGIGGLAGFANPGVDQDGKNKSRLSAALRGALGGGAVGGLGGGLGGAAVKMRDDRQLALREDEAAYNRFVRRAFPAATDAAQMARGALGSPAATNAVQMARDALGSPAATNAVQMARDALGSPTANDAAQMARIANAPHPARAARRLLDVIGRPTANDAAAQPR